MSSQPGEVLVIGSIYPHAWKPTPAVGSILDELLLVMLGPGIVLEGMLLEHLLLRRSFLGTEAR